MFRDKRFACLREGASAKAGHAGVAISILSINYKIASVPSPAYRRQAMTIF